MNSLGTDLLQFSSATPVGMKNLVHPAEIELLLKKLSEAGSLSSVFNLDLRLKSAAGEYRWFNCQFKKKEFTENEPDQWLCIADLFDEGEIVNRKLKEEVNKNQYLIKQIADATPNILYVLDVFEERFVFVNKHVEDVLGYSVNEIYGFGGNLLDKIIHKDDLPHYRSIIRSFLLSEDDAVYEIVVRVKKKTGGYLWIKNRQKIFKRNKYRNQTQIIGIAQDITEQRLQEEKIKVQQEQINKSEQELKKAQEIARLGSFSFDLKSRQLTSTFGLENILGTCLTNCNYQLYADFIYKEDLGFFQGQLKMALLKRSDFFIEHRIVTCDKQIKWVITRGKVLADHNMLPDKLTGIVHDITEKKIAQLKLDENQKLINHIAAALPDSFYVYDIEQKRNIFHNRSLKEFLGYPSDGSTEDLEFKSSVFHPSDLPKMLEGLERVQLAKPGEIFEMEYRMLHADGSYRWLRAREIVFKRDKDGKPQQILGVVNDITERKVAEQELQRLNDELEDIVFERTKELKKNEEELRLITDALPVLIGYVDKEQKFQFNNKAYEDWFDIPVILMKGVYVEDVIGMDNYRRMEPYINEVLCGNRVNFEVDMELPYKEKKRVNAIYIPHKEKEVVQGFYVLLSDITYRKKVEESLVQALKEADAKNNELTKINEVLDTFVYAAAHDLKSPVTNLKLFLEMINKTDDSQKQKDYLKIIESSVMRLDNIIKGLVEVIQVQSNLQPSIKELDFSTVFSGVRQELDVFLKESNGVIEADFKHCSKIVYKEAYLVSIIRNLVSNAIKYHHPERQLFIKVLTVRENDFVKFVIKDNGIGIDLMRYGKSLFKPFKRFSKQGEGTGIGLHLIKSIVEKNGGRIEVESEPAEGTMFIVYLKEYEVNPDRTEIYTT